MKKRVVILGASGFVGSAIAKNLSEKYEVVAVARKDCDFLDATCCKILDVIIKDGDIVVCAAAKAPAKNWEMFAENVTMISHIIEGLKNKQLSYILNISSDAIYADSMDRISESSTIAPQAAHGLMHAMREYLLEKNLHAPIGHLRPTLIYGEDDPHNGYGPNSFIRRALAGQAIELFGNGEEQRDHIFVGDVAALAAAMIDQKTAHSVNAVTGKVISFMEIAELIRNTRAGIEILTKPRSGPMPHNGYRAFSNDAAKKLCPETSFTDIAAYIQRMIGRA
jgi:nucleoside-diphosphate-sugar epimerase